MGIDYDYSEILDDPPSPAPSTFYNVRVSATPTALSAFDGHANEWAFYSPITSTWTFTALSVGDRFVATEPFTSTMTGGGLVDDPIPGVANAAHTHVEADITDLVHTPPGGFTLTEGSSVDLAAGAAATIASGVTLKEVMQVQEFGIPTFNRAAGFHSNFAEFNSHSGWSNEIRAFNTSWTQYASNNTALNEPLQGRLPSTQTVGGVLIFFRGHSDDIGYEWRLRLLANNMSTVLHEQNIQVTQCNCFVEIPLIADVASVRGANITPISLLPVNDAAVIQFQLYPTMGTRNWMAHPSDVVLRQNGANVEAVNTGIWQRRFRAVTIT